MSTQLRAVLHALIGLIAAAVLTVAGPATASAHTTIDLVTPPDGSRLQEAPTELVVQFGESLPLKDTHVRFAAASGKTLAEGSLTSDTAASANDQGLFVLPAGLSTGSYIVTVTARGSDGHTITQGFAFTIGDAPLIRSEGASSSSDAPGMVAASTLGSVFTSVGLVGLAFVYVATWCWPAAARSMLGRRIALTGISLSAAGTLIDLALLTIAQQTSLVGAFDSQAGRLIGLRVVALVLVTIAIRAWIAADSASARASRENFLFLAAIPFLLGVVGSSHAAGDSWSLVTLVAGCAHVGAMALWMGGLAWLWRASHDHNLPAGAAAQFSRTAAACAGTTLATGVFLTLRLTGGGNIQTLTSTYGVALLAKVGMVALLILMATRTHRLVIASTQTDPLPAARPASRPGTATLADPVTRPETTHRITAALRAEAFAGTAVLIAAGILSAIGPGA